MSKVNENKKYKDGAQAEFFTGYKQGVPVVFASATLVDASMSRGVGAAWGKAVLTPSARAKEVVTDL